MGRSKNPETVAAEQKDDYDRRRRAVQIYYRDSNGEVRYWTSAMADVGQFEVMDSINFIDFKAVYQRLHGESSVRELHDMDRYEPGDNLDA